MKRVKTEESEEGRKTATLEGETMDEFAGAVHDRCSTKLAMATFKWVARSHMVHAGTPVIICDRDSVYKGSRGTVVQTLPVSAKYIVRVDQLADAGERNYRDCRDATRI